MIRLRSAAEHVRESLFFVPAMLLVLAVALAQGTIRLDAAITAGRHDLPVPLTSTVDSARALLSTIAGATITFAGIAVSISLLLIQLAASQFSPRVLYSFFRDPFTKWVVGFVVATFTYCLLVLRVVRDPRSEEVGVVIPNISVLVATAMGVGAVVAVVGLIHHTARAMQVGQTIKRIVEDARERIDALLERSHDGLRPASIVPEPEGSPLIVESRGEGWVQQIDGRAILAALPDEGVARLEVPVGGFLTTDTPLAFVWPAPPDDERDRTSERIREAVDLGPNRTTQEDVAFSIQQLVDIALRALSPSVNDPTTAIEATLHIGSILRSLLAMDLPPTSVSDERGRVLLRPLEPSFEDHVRLSFDQLRQAAASHPAAAIVVLETIGMLVHEAARLGHPRRIDVFREEAALLLAGCERAQLLDHDLARIRQAAKGQGL